MMNFTFRQVGIKRNAQDAQFFVLIAASHECTTNSQPNIHAIIFVVAHITIIIPVAFGRGCSSVQKLGMKDS